MSEERGRPIFLRYRVIDVMMDEYGDACVKLVSCEAKRCRGRICYEARTDDARSEIVLHMPIESAPKIRQMVKVQYSWGITPSGKRS